MARIVGNGVLVPGVDQGIHLLVAPGNSGVTKCPGVPVQPFPVPLSPGKRETGNASSERDYSLKLLQGQARLA